MSGLPVHHLHARSNRLAIVSQDVKAKNETLDLLVKASGNVPSMDSLIGLIGLRIRQEANP